ncbi:ATP phosphoribosyltransferase [Symbiodinium microadriaticum]|uniref:ATP phosphoribosyltransferase n=1 Tax=Symbiodinium microadriaticum TaxID=2951 RepID=A0A1Q9C8F9_SYMMI|nr:ATP phosphoribosyltransferase [Symbiodinium microadriaticum]
MPLQILTDVPPLPANYASRAGLSDSVVKSLQKCLKASGLCLVHGAGGMGKTVATCAALLDETTLCETFPQGAAYVTVGQSPDVLSLQSTLLRAFGVHDPPADVSDGYARLYNVLSGCKVLVVLDDVWNASHLECFVPMRGRPKTWSNVAVLVTTRFADLVQKAELLRLGDLTDAESRELLHLKGDGALLTRLAKLCSRSPLALSILGATGQLEAERDASQKPATVFTAFCDELAAQEKAEPNAIKRCIGLAHKRLEQQDKDLYLGMAVFPDDVLLPIAALRTIFRDKDLDTQLPRLERLHLIRKEEGAADGPRIRLHDLSLEFVKEQAPRCGGETALHQELLTNYSSCLEHMIGHESSSCYCNINSCQRRREFLFLAPCHGKMAGGYGGDSPGSVRKGSSMPDGVMEENVVLFAVPKKGRIHEDVMKILKGAGFDAKRPDRLDVAMCKDVPIKLVFLPAADIPSYVMEGNVDIGISGSDMLEESMIDAGFDAECAPIKVILKLGIGKCRLCLQAPQQHCDRPPKDFVGQRIVTSFPALTKRYFERLAGEDAQQKTHIKEVSGSVEAACGLGLADAVVDLVETGTTMKAAGLDIVSEVLETEALLFQQLPTEANGLSSGSKADVLKLIENRVSGYLTATKHVMIVCNCHHDSLAAVCQLMPGKRSPTVTELKEESWHSVSALVKNSESNRIMDDLSKAGAKDILCLALANTRM